MKDMALNKQDKQAIANAQRVSEALQKQKEKPEIKADLTKLARELAERRLNSEKEEK